jgi:translation initiation factor IF-3
MSTQDAMARAEEQNLELVEVNQKAQPPVCKILDYGKFKYETAKRERDSKRGKKPQEMKEVKFRPKTGIHDFDFKIKHARRFLEEGNKVRLLVQFRGREIVHPETGRAVLERVCKVTADLATIVQLAKMEGNRMSMIIGPKARQGSERGARKAGQDNAKADGAAKPEKSDKATKAAPTSDKPPTPAAKAAEAGESKAEA